MVLPYRRTRISRASRVAVEAVTGGIPVITTRDTWTAAGRKLGAGSRWRMATRCGLAEAMADMRAITVLAR